MSDTPSQLASLLRAVATLTDETTALKRSVGDLKVSVDETKEIVAAWEAVKTGGKFVKWLAGVGSGLAGLWLMARALGANFFK